jgi:serine/threonine-protein kinase
MKHGVRCWTATLFVLGIGLWAGRVEAQGGETSRTAAESLFVEAKKLMDAGKFGEACSKFADSQRLDPGVGTLLNLALCYERYGKIASAWSTYREAAAAARSAGQGERETLARQRATALEPRLSRLTVAVPQALSAAEGLQIRLDSVVLPSTLWGVAAPVDAGDHSVEVSAKGRKPWSTRVQVAPPSNPTVVVPELDLGPVEPVVTTPQDAEPPRVKSPQRTIGIVAMGAGVVGVGVGTIFGLSARSTYHGVDAECSEVNKCTSNAVEARHSAYEKATVSTIAFGVGGVALATGVILWFTAPKAGHDVPKVGLAFGFGTVAIGGRW